jgi:hypothetical protein
MAVAARDHGPMTVRGCVRRNRRVRPPGRPRLARLPRPAAAAPLAMTLLAMALVAGCAATQTSGGGAASGTAAGRQAASPVATAQPSASSHGSAGSGAPGTPGAGMPGSATRAACVAWPSGSAGTVLLITSDSNGKTYCVRTGETVQVVLSGTLALADGSQPPHLTGNALAAVTARRAQVLRMPEQSYIAVRPGTAVLTVVRLPCHSLQPMRTAPATASPMAGALARTASPASEMAYTSDGARAGGAPIGPDCALQQVLRVFIIVT